MEYLGASLLEADANILNGTIAKAVYDRRRGVLPGMSKTDLFRVSESILPIYQKMVLAGKPPFELKNGDTYGIVYAIMDETGYSRNTVIMYLATLEELAKEGTILAVHYNPQVPSDVITTKSAGEKVFDSNIVKGMEKGITKFTAMALLLGLGYLAVTSGVFKKKPTRFA